MLVDETVPVIEQEATQLAQEAHEYIVSNEEKAQRTFTELLDYYFQYGKNRSIEYVNLPNCNGIIDTVTGEIQLDESLLGKFSNLHDGALIEELWHFYQLSTQGLLGRLLIDGELQQLETEVVGYILNSGFTEVQ